MLMLLHRIAAAQRSRRCSLSPKQLIWLQNTACWVERKGEIHQKMIRHCMLHRANMLLADVVTRTFPTVFYSSLKIWRVCSRLFLVFPDPAARRCIGVPCDVVASDALSLQSQTARQPLGACSIRGRTWNVENVVGGRCKENARQMGVVMANSQISEHDSVDNT